jgi:hypothetical protein
MVGVITAVKLSTLSMAGGMKLGPRGRNETYPNPFGDRESKSDNHD